MKKALTLTVACLLVSAAWVVGDDKKGTPEEAKALLDKAVTAMQSDESKAIAAFNDPKGGYVDRDLYVFCFGADGKITRSPSSRTVTPAGTAVRSTTAAMRPPSTRTAASRTPSGVRTRRLLIAKSGK